MPAVDQASYRKFEGTAHPGKGAALAIAGTMIGKARRQRFVRFFIYVVPVLSCGIATIVFSFLYVNRDQIPLMKRLADANLLAWFNRAFQDRIAFVALLMAAVVGAPLVAEDRRAKALPLYFSRPIRHIDYVLGKLFTLWFFLGILLVGPPILLYLVEISLNPAEGVVLDQLPTLGKSLIPAVARVIPLSVIMLAISSLMQRTSHASLLFFGVILPVQVIATILAHQVFEDPNWLALSPKECVDAISRNFLPMPEMFSEGPLRPRLAQGWAWGGLAAWTAAGLAVLVTRIRKVEVVQ
jgi:ABC-2 type transport system permease protein